MYYCVYIVTYHGNDLPKHYIGSTLTKKLEKGYRGSAVYKGWQEKVKTNPDLFTYEILSYHNTRKDAYIAEGKEQRARNVMCDSNYANLTGKAQPEKKQKKEKITVVKKKKEIKSDIDFPKEWKYFSDIDQYLWISNELLQQVSLGKRSKKSANHCLEAFCVNKFGRYKI